MTEAADTNPDSDVAAAREATAWCAGLPFVAETALSAVERELLATWVNKARKSARRDLVLALVPIAGFATFHLGGMYLAAMLTLLLVCISPLVLIRAFQSWSASRRYARELAAGRVLRFEGSGSKHEVGFVDGYHRKLVTSGLLKVEPGAIQTLAVLPVSRAVLRANDAPGRADLRAEVVEVAPAPASTFQVPLPGWVVTNAAAPMDVKRRRLTGGELAEIMDKVGQLRRLSGGFWVLTVLTGLVFLVWRHDGYPVPPQPITQLIPAGLWVYSIYEVVRNQVRALRLRRDLALGWVVTLEPNADARGERVGVARVPSEFLLASRLAWTVDGIPAAWRGSKWFSTLLIDRRP